MSGHGPPFALQVEITSRCNLKCKMCPLTLGATLTSGRAAHMEEATWAQVVEAARGVGRVILAGFGENATNSRFAAMLKELDDLGVRTSFATNGIGMRPRLVEEIAQLSHLEHINVSIDSPDPEVYHLVRGGRLEQAWRGLERLVAGMPKRVQLTVSSVAMDVNVESLVAMPDRLAATGVKTYVLQGLTDRSGELADHDLRRNPNAPAAIREIQRRCDELGLYLTRPSGVGLSPESEAAEPAEAGLVEFSETRTRQCLAPWKSPFVDRTGLVFPCCHGDSSAVMGSLAEASFDEVWRSPTFDRFRDDLEGGADLPSICRKCTAVKIGPHPRRFAAEIDSQVSELWGESGLRLVVRNAGKNAWTAETPLAIGVKGDLASALRLPSWASSNRIAYMAERIVKPSEVATFEFSVGRGGQEVFMLVVEGVCWLEGTEFELPLPLPVAERPTWRIDQPAPAIPPPSLRDRLLRSARAMASRAWNRRG